MDKLLDRFINYVSFDTQSKPNTRSVPSTECQLKLAKVIKKELIELGLDNVRLDEHCYLMATLPSNVSRAVAPIGFIAHLDTSPDYSGKNVCPQVIESYRGGDIALGVGDEVLSPVKFSILHQMLGKTLIVTDGSTLLGADNKAGIAEIITAMARLKASAIEHGDIHIAFTPDEEVGKGASFFDVKSFGAQWAYTIDGGGVGELECENFNAATATIKIHGNNVHPGSAKGVMVNALTLAAQFQLALPEDQRAENSEDYQGFFHLNGFKGNVERADMTYLIRDFDREDFEQRKMLLQQVAERLNVGLPKNTGIEVNIVDNYYNMRDEVAKHPHIVVIAKQAMQDCHITPVLKPIRGGTDGAQLSFKGLPCPNIFTGGYNFHSKHEFITVEGMESAVAVIMKIAELTAKHEVA